MNNEIGLKPAVKVVAFWLGFIVLHYLYVWFPFAPFALISGVSEAVFQHAKIAFYTYLIVNIVEVAIYAKKATSRKDFIFSRLLSTLIVPWLMMVFWYIGPAVYGKPMPSIPMEIVYANLAMIALAISAVTLEQGFTQIKFTRGMMIVIVVLLVVSILHFTFFTYVMPWADVFTPPNY